MLAGKVAYFRQSLGDLLVGLVAYWPLNETATSGDVLAGDGTGRGNHLGSNNSVLSVAGKVGNAREFVAASLEYLSRADSADVRLGNSDWTISAWVYVPTAANGTQFLIAKDASGLRNWNISVERNSSTTANRFGIGMFRVGGIFVGSAVGQNRNNSDFINRWWHLTATNNAGVVTLYENGAVVSGTGSAATVTRPAGQTWAESASAINIGRREISPEGYFTGQIDEVAIWSRALSASDIGRLWNNGNGINLASTGASSIAFPAVANADAQSWINRVYANGGTVSTSTATAVNDFCNSIDAAGIRDRFYRLNLFAGTGLSAALVPLYRGQSLGGTQFGNATDTNFNFAAGDYVETGSTAGLKGNGSSKYLATGFRAPTASLSASSFHLSCYVQGVEAGGSSRIFMGNATNQVGVNLTTSIGWVTGGSVSSGVVADTSFPNGGSTDRQGLLLAATNGSRASTYYNNATSVATQTSAAPDFETGAGDEFTVVARNFIGTIQLYSLNKRFRAYSLGAGMSASQVSAFNTAMQAFQTALTRNV